MNLRQRQNTPKHSQSGVFDKLPGFLIVVIAALIFATYYFGGEEEGNPFEGLEFERPYNPEEEKVEPKGIEDLIVKKGRGYDLAPEVRRKMEEEIYQLENAEQYALLATEAGWYSCPSCMKQYGKLTIFLLPGEVIKYGTSVRGSLRYSQKY